MCTVDSTTDVVRRYARAICTAPSTWPEDVGAAFGVDLAGARLLGTQLTCPPPPELAALVLVLGLHTGQVSTVELRPVAPTSLDELRQKLGPSRVTPPGPHDSVPTIILREVWPEDSPRACAVLVRPSRTWPREPLVESVILHPRGRPDGVD